MQPLYMTDAYLQEFKAKIKSVKDGKYIILEQTAFYPQSGGQLCDHGLLIKNNETFKVVSVKKVDGEISHEVDHPGLNPGDEVTGKIDWPRRYQMMRSHTAAHILSAVLYQEAGVLITGNQLDLDYCKIDFNLENFDREKLTRCIQKANEIAKRNLPVHIKFMPRKEVEAKPEMQKLAKGLPAGIDTFRLIEIESFDIQADGGTHVKNTQEIGELIFIKAENKGSQRRRVYFKLT